MKKQYIKKHWDNQDYSKKPIYVTLSLDTEKDELLCTRDSSKDCPDYKLFVSEDVNKYHVDLYKHIQKNGDIHLYTVEHVKLKTLGGEVEQFGDDRFATMHQPYVNDGNYMYTSGIESCLKDMRDDPSKLIYVSLTLQKIYDNLEEL